jgi:8-hydroxy-5-deazaflavin:NADPH oxidoreductase
MTYAIVGSGNVGSALAALSARAGVAVSIANTRGPDSLTELTEVLGPTVHPVALEEALHAAIIFMAIPFGAVGP